MIKKQIAFLTGLHRSGTSPLYRLLCKHPDVSGFSDTGVPEDEGQHLQSVVPAAKVFGGPGRFAFDARSYLDERSCLATPESASCLWESWRVWWDITKPLLLEKSPPTIVRLRFFHALFPDCRAIVLVRHPLIVAKATQKWSGTSLTELVLHWCIAHERLMHDLPFLGHSVLVVQYEHCVNLNKLFEFLHIEPLPDVGGLENRNGDYPISDADLQQIPTDALESRFGDVFRRFGYVLDSPDPILNAMPQNS